MPVEENSRSYKLVCASYGAPWVRRAFISLREPGGQAGRQAGGQAGRQAGGHPLPPRHEPKLRPVF